MEPRHDIGNLPEAPERERQSHRDEVAIDLEDRNSKKGTPRRPSETGDIRQLHAHQPANDSQPVTMVTE